MTKSQPALELTFRTIKRMNAEGLPTSPTTIAQQTNRTVDTISVHLQQMRALGWITRSPQQVPGPEPLWVTHEQGERVPAEVPVDAALLFEAMLSSIEEDVASAVRALTTARLRLNDLKRQMQDGL